MAVNLLAWVLDLNADLLQVQYVLLTGSSAAPFPLCFGLWSSEMHPVDLDGFGFFLSPRLSFLL